DIFHLSPEETLIIPPMLEELQEQEGLKKLVDKLRTETDGVPIGVKITASRQLESDLKIIIEANIDFISIDGGQAGTRGAAPILDDDFGLPTIYALVRTIDFLKKKKVKNKISLLLGGGLTTPGECLKALA